MHRYLYSLLLFLRWTLALNFPFENIQLTDAETADYPAIRFGSLTSPAPEKECRVIPTDSDWPTEAEWARFNTTLGGVLLKPAPLAAPCYDGPLYDAAKCTQLKRAWGTIGTQYVWESDAIG